VGTPLPYPAQDLDNDDHDFRQCDVSGIGNRVACRRKQIAGVHPTTSVKTDMHSQRERPVWRNLRHTYFEGNVSMRLQRNIFEPLFRHERGRSISERNISDFNEDMTCLGSRDVRWQDDVTGHCSHQGLLPL
jgi:hypothetical protein